MTNTNSRDIVSEFISRCDIALSGGDADPYELLDDGLTLIVNGMTPISGYFPGLSFIKAMFLDAVKMRVNRANLFLEELVGTGNRVGSLLKVKAETVDGKIYNENEDSCGCVFEVIDGKITEIFFFPDTTLIETVLYNRKYVPN